MARGHSHNAILPSQPSFSSSSLYLCEAHRRGERMSLPHLLGRLTDLKHEANPSWASGPLISLAASRPQNQPDRQEWQQLEAISTNLASLPEGFPESPFGIITRNPVGEEQMNGEGDTMIVYIQSSQRCS